MESPKLRLMCSYGGHIVPRPNNNNKSLSYAGGDTRIVSVDRRTSLPALTAHLSRILLNNRPFHLKYQIPNEDLDSLISVTTDEDLDNMLDEHDRITPPARIRLFLFPVKADSIGSSRLLDPKSDSWFCDALKNTRIMGSAEDSGLLLEVRTDGGSRSKAGAESFVLETSSSFGSTGSSFSVSNSPPVGMVVPSEENCGLSLLDRKVRVPSSASIASENSAGGASSSPRAGLFQDPPLIQVSPEAPSILTKSESTPDPSIGIPTQNTVPVFGYPLTRLPDGKQLQHETQLFQGGMHYLPQFPANQMPISSYYPIYQMPMHQQPVHYPSNQPYPIYLVPVRPTQYHNMPMPCNITDSNNGSSCGPHLHPQTATIASNIAHNEIFKAQTAAESTTNIYRNIPSKPVTPDSVASATQINEFDEDIVYSQIYKSQPSAPIFPSQYQTITNGIAVMLSESSVQLQPSHAKDQAAINPI